MAADTERILISADSDFGVILANRRETQPSFILFRHDIPAIPKRLAEHISRIAASLAEELSKGCIISVSRDRVRLRMLPLR